MKTTLILGLVFVEKRERCPTCSHPTVGPFVAWTDGEAVSAKMCITCLRIGADFVKRRGFNLALDGSPEDGSTFQREEMVRSFPSEYVPQAVAQALDAIDREEDEVGDHRRTVDTWRRNR
jgi:hypothetical protein